MQVEYRVLITSLLLGEVQVFTLKYRTLAVATNAL